MLIFLLFFIIIYISIGIGLTLMVYLLNEHLYMEAFIGRNYISKLLFLWPILVKKIYNHNH